MELTLRGHGLSLVATNSVGAAGFNPGSPEGVPLGIAQRKQTF